MSDKNARYEGDWYYCWLIERRDGPQPRWLGEYAWETDANKAIWYSRKADADAAQRHQLGGVPNIFVCEHGFVLPIDQRSLLAARPSPDTAAHLDTVAGIEQFAKYRVPWGDTSDTLARCKTCGHEAAFREPEHRGYEHAMISVECSNTSCGMKTPPHYKTRVEAAKAWNRKATDTKDVQVDTASLVRALLDAARQLQRSAELCGQHLTDQASAQQLRAQAALLRAYAASMTPIDNKGEV